jgi:UDP-glucose:(glucosyl)LPS alpha-1,2-glucosyltransferase
MRSCRTAAQRARLQDRLAAVAVASQWLGDRWALPGVKILPNCLDLKALPPPLAQRDPEILFVGRIVADKGADAFVAACAAALPHLPGWHARMIGADRFGADSPDTPFLRALRPAAAAAGVTMVGYRPHDDVLQAMARAAIVVVPSRWPEPFGMTALEAMACGAALAYAPRGGLPEVVGAAGVTIDPDDAAAMATTLVALARDPARCAVLGQAGRQRAALFDVSVIAARLDALRADILGAWAMPGHGAVPI